MRIRSTTLAALAAGTLLMAAWLAAPASTFAAAPAASPISGGTAAFSAGPRIAFLLACPSARDSIARELGLTGRQLAAARRLAHSLDEAQAGLLRDSDARLAATGAGAGASLRTAEAGRYNAQLDRSESDALAALAATVGKPETAVSTALQHAWTEQVVRAQQAQQYNTINAALGVRSYRILATSFTDGLTGAGVAVPDKYAKFASLGWRSSIPSQYQKGYPATTDWAVALAYNKYSVAHAKVQDTGPWNVDDNYWDAPNDPLRPRRLFKDLPQGMPEAFAGFYRGYNGGKDSSGRKILNGAGIDLLPAAWVGLGVDAAEVNQYGYKDFVDVWWLWEPGPSIPPVNMNRVAGADRYATSELLMDRSFPKGAPALVLATGANFPDAICAAPLAATYGGPLLLIDPKVGITTGLYNKLKTWSGLKRVFIIGAQDSMGKGVYDSIRSLPGMSPANVTRLAGANRYETSALIARSIMASTGTVKKMVVTTGEDFPDALSVAPLAAVNKWPIVLVLPGGIPATSSAAIAAIKPASSLIVGGTGAVGTAVASKLPLPYRLPGVDRWSTNVAVADYAEHLGSSFNYLGVVNGIGYADALAAGAYLGKAKGIEVLVEPSGVPDAIRRLLSSRRDYVRICDVIGGTGAVDDWTYANIRLLLRP